MSLEHSPQRAVPGNAISDGPAIQTPPDGPDYWHTLINEKIAGDFLGLTDRAMQKMRQIGNGPSFIWISSRCLRYRRADLRAWAEARMRKSTSDPGAETV